jgi:alpha-1,6-mannosyltransferase
MHVKFNRFIIGSIFIGAIFYLAYFVPRNEIYLTLALYFGLFIGYIYLAKKETNLIYILGLGLIARLFLLFASPLWSDDYYRFLWDGALLTERINPYLFKPSEIASLPLLSSDFLALYPKLNSPEYYTVYPTVIQLLNLICVYLGTTFNGALLVMKSAFLLAELTVCHLLYTLLPKDKKHLVAWYWLCPLVLMEFMGNLHHEVWMILFVLAAVKALREDKCAWSGFYLSLAVFTKLTPMLFFPFFFLKVKNKIEFCIIFGLISIILIIPMCAQEALGNFSQSLNLYFTTFEFNSSFYKLFEPLFWKKEGFRLAYKVLLIVVFGGFFFYWHKRKKSLLVGLSSTYFIYLLGAQSVHPWYILPLLALFVLNELPFYYLVWMAFIPLSYYTYRQVPYQQSIWVNVIEYSFLSIALVYTFYRKQIGVNLSVKKDLT